MPTRGYRDPRPCLLKIPDPDPITGEIKRRRCDLPVRGGHPLCPEHWRSVAPGLRAALTEAWRHFDLTGDGWDAYEAARVAVMDAAELAAWTDFGGRPDDDN